MSRSSTLLVCALSMLASCGGGQNNGAETLSKVADLGRTPAAMPTAAQTQLLLEKSGKINATELQLAQVEANATANRSSASGKSIELGGGKTAIINSTQTYRFYNTQTQAHFYTISTAERDAVQATLPQFHYEGPAFSVSAVAAEGLSPVYRYFNVQTGVHFYTISAGEKAFVEANLPQFQPEGIAYYASQVADFGLKPLYRFYLSTKGFHFYTGSEPEKTNVINTLPQYTFENVGYYVVNTNPAVLPHSGVTDQQCFEAGNPALVPCSSSGALALNNQQDGHRTAINPISYSEVPKATGGHYARTECVKDNVTGLVWEGKTASGARGGADELTHYEAVGDYMAISPSGAFATQANLDAVSNSLGYVKYVNSIALCGYSDWRLPSPAELLGIVNYGVDNPAVSVAWFPNSAGASMRYTTSETSSGGNRVSVVDMNAGASFYAFKDNVSSFHGESVFSRYFGKIRLVHENP